MVAGIDVSRIASTNVGKSRPRSVPNAVTDPDSTATSGSAGRTATPNGIADTKPSGRSNAVCRIGT